VREPCARRLFHHTRTSDEANRMRKVAFLLTGIALLIASVLLAPAPVRGQGSSDIFLATLSVRDGVVSLGGVVNITVRPGYDNQPHFTADGGGLLYTSIREDGQADVYRYDFGGREIRRVTRTPESEYSPTPLPPEQGSGFSVVRVEADSTQRLWRFVSAGPDATTGDAGGAGAGGLLHASLVLEEVKPVGYHAWGDAYRVALFVLGSPATLQLADTRTGRATAVAENIGRSLQRVPGRPAVSFVQRLEEGRSFLVELNVETGRLRTLVELPAGGEFHAWLPDGIVLLTRGTKLLQWNPARDRVWREVADFSGRGLEVTRLAVSPAGDRLALVGQSLPER
jgi:hypothetical protein